MSSLCHPLAAAQLSESKSVSSLLRRKLLMEGCFYTAASVLPTDRGSVSGPFEMCLKYLEIRVLSCEWLQDLSLGWSAGSQSLKRPNQIPSKPLAPTRRGLGSSSEHAVYNSADAWKLSHTMLIKDLCLFKHILGMLLVIVPVTKAATNLSVDSEDLLVKMKMNVMLNNYYFFKMHFMRCPSVTLEISFHGAGEGKIISRMI